MLFFNEGCCVSFQCSLLGNCCYGVLVQLRACGASRGVWGWLWFSCGMVQCGKGLIPIFEHFFCTIGKDFILAGGLGAGLSF